MTLQLQTIDLRLMGWPSDALDMSAPEGYDSSGVLSTPLEDLTTQALDGNGVFDALMISAKLHLQEEFEANRITGKEYSTVYLGMLTAVLGQSVQFLLNQLQVEKINAEIGLLRQKTVTELGQTDDYFPWGLGFNGKPDDGSLDDSGGLINPDLFGEVSGVLGKQKGLFQKQTDGFDRDAEQKLAKMMVDSWSVRQTTDGALVDTNGLDDLEINKVLDVAKDGIGVVT